MTSSRSAAQITSSTTVVPTCDAWINMQYDTDKAPTVNDGYGILGTHRVSAGLYGISFSNPEQFGGGAYVAICTPEIGYDAGYGPQTINNPDFFNATETGKSAGIRVINFNYAGFHTGGGTATKGDSNSEYAVRSNVAVFALTTENNLRIPEVGNWIQDSTLSTFPPSGVPSPIGISNSYKVVQSIPNSTSTRFIALPVSVTPAWFGGKPWTFSIFIKGEVGGEQICIANATNIKTLITLTNTWKRYSVTSNASAIFSTLSSVQIGLQGSATSGLAGVPTSSSATYYIAAAQLEPGSLMTEFVSTPVGTQPTSYTGTKGNQDARKRLVPGAGGFGTVGATYSSSLFNKADKRKAVAYGTIVIPPNKGNSSTVSAYIENGFNVKGVSAGANSLFDVSFVTPMTSNTYCTILTGEYESNTETNLTAATPEFSLLLIRAGLNNKYKTTSGFRVESLKQNPADNSWTQRSVIYQSGLTERIHFMVFGEALQGQSYYLSSPYTLSEPITNLDYDVYGSHWAWVDGVDGNQTLINLAGELGYVPGKKSIVPILSTYMGATSGYFSGVMQRDLGTTYINQTGLLGGSVAEWAKIIKNVPQSRRTVEFRSTCRILPVTTSDQRERLVQYYAIRDGFTYDSVHYPTGVTNAGFTVAAESINGHAYSTGTTYSGATFSASRRILGLISDEQANDKRIAVNELVRALGAAGVTPGIFQDDSENAPGTMGLYHLGTSTKYKVITNSGIASGAFVAGTDPDRALAVSGVTSEFLYDYYGISASGSSRKSKLVNRADPEMLRALISDPRIATYQFSTSGITTADSPTFASRFMEIYGKMCKRWNVTGVTAQGATPMIGLSHAVDIVYAHGAAIFGATPNFPYFATERGSGILGYQARTMNNFNPYLIWVAWDQTVAEWYWGHYRSIAYSDGMSAGIIYNMYGTGNIDADNMEIAVDANLGPVSEMSLTGEKTINSVTMYGNSLGGNTNPALYTGFVPNPTSNAEKYCLNGQTYSAGDYANYNSSSAGLPMGDGTVNYIIMPNRRRKFYPKTAIGLNGTGWNGSSTQIDAGSGWGKTGTIWTPPVGATVESTPSAGATGFTAWGGFTALAGDYIWVQNPSGITNPVPLTVGNNVGGITAGTKKSISVLESLSGYGIVAGTTFTIEHTTSNSSYHCFMFDVQKIRAMLRSNLWMTTKGHAPFIAPWQEVSHERWSMDPRYFYEHAYHLLLSSGKYLQWFRTGASSVDGAGDGQAIVLHKVLEAWRNISGNSSVRCVTTNPFPYDSPVLTSGGQLNRGPMAGSYLWRMTARPGLMGLDETVVLGQTARGDIPDRLVIPGGAVPEHTYPGTSQKGIEGTRGVWLITKSAIPPVYTISSLSSPTSGIVSGSGTPIGR